MITHNPEGRAGKRSIQMVRSHRASYSRLSPGQICCSMSRKGLTAAISGRNRNCFLDNPPHRILSRGLVWIFRNSREDFWTSRTSWPGICCLLILVFISCAKGWLRAGISTSRRWSFFNVVGGQQYENHERRAKEFAATPTDWLRLPGTA